MKARRLFAILILFCSFFACGCELSEENPFVESSSAEPSAAEAVTSEASFETTSAEEIDLPTDTVLHFVACGDNLIHPSVYFHGMEVYAEEHGQECTYAAANLDNYDFHSIYENVEPAMKEADFCYVNQETLFMGGTTAISGYPRFNSPEIIGTTLYDIGADIINLAHNHTLDCGSDAAIINTAAFFRNLGMTPIGYYQNTADTENIVTVEKDGIRIALLAYTEHTNGLRNSSSTCIPYLEESLVRKQVAIAKEQADLVIVSAHWGEEYRWNPTNNQKKYAQLFCDLGVDVVLGMHSHCIEPVEWLTNESGHRTLVAYSLGNFVSGMHEGMCHLEGMLKFDIRKDLDSGDVTIESPMFVPLVLHFEAGKSVNTSIDTGYRKFKIYYLTDYTEELAASHGVHKREKQFTGYQLYGGKFDLECLYTTVKTLIPAEFLSEEFR